MMHSDLHHANAAPSAALPAEGSGAEAVDTVIKRIEALPWLDHRPTLGSARPVASAGAISPERIRR